MLTRAQELLIHGKVMGKCCHESAKVVHDKVCRMAGIQCDKCGAALFWVATRGARDAWLVREQPGRVLQNHIPRYGRDAVLVDDVLRALRRSGWTCQQIERAGKHVCIVERGDTRLEGPARDDRGEAVYCAARKLAERNALTAAESVT